jgi:hypothetical protein
MATHYDAPASVPADYGVLASYVGAGADTDADPGAHAPRTPSRSRSPEQRRAHMSPYVPVPGSAPAAAHGAHTALPTEATPLLVPRIVEPVAARTAATKRASVFWEEFRVLFKYTLPILGAPPRRVLSDHAADAARTQARMCSSTRSSSRPSSPSGT